MNHDDPEIEPPTAIERSITGVGFDDAGDALVDYIKHGPFYKTLEVEEGIPPDLACYTAECGGWCLHEEDFPDMAEDYVEARMWEVDREPWSPEMTFIASHVPHIDRERIMVFDDQHIWDLIRLNVNRMEPRHHFEILKGDPNSLGLFHNKWWMGRDFFARALYVYQVGWYKLGVPPEWISDYSIRVSYMALGLCLE